MKKRWHRKQYRLPSLKALIGNGHSSLKSIYQDHHVEVSERDQSVGPWGHPNLPHWTHSGGMSESKFTFYA